MRDDTEQAPTAGPTVQQDRGTWFFLSLLAVLFWGMAGVVGSLLSFVALRLLAKGLPRGIVLAIAVVVGALATVLARAILDR